MRLVAIVVFLVVTAPVALAAQDESGVRRTAVGYMIDFDNQDLRVVLAALAEAAGHNVVFSDLPPARTTLRMGQPVPREQLLDVLRSIVESNGLMLTVEGSLVRIERSGRQGSRGRPPRVSRVELFTYRLRHTSAAQLAPVLMGLFSGAPGVRVTRPGASDAPQRDGVTQGGITSPPRVIVRPDTTGTGAEDDQGARIGAAMEQAIRQARPQLPQEMTRAADDDLAADALSDAATEIRIVAEEATNTLLVRATAHDWELIKGIVESVDLRPLQVLIEVMIVEVTRTKDLDLGVGATATHTKARRTEPNVTAELPSVVGARDFVLQLTGGRGAIDFTAALNALATRGDLRVRSLPVIIAQNNKQAVLNVGSARPFVQVSQTVPSDPTGRVETIQYLDVGTTLTLTPTINADGYVNLVVTQTANTATNEIQFNAPVLSKREATTQIFVRDGQTTVIGGLADNTHEFTRSGIPILSWLPLIGGLFGSTHRRDVQSELYLFLTPHIISDDADIDRLRDAVQQQSDLLQRVPITPMIPPRQTDTVPAAARPVDPLRGRSDAAPAPAPWTEGSPLLGTSPWREASVR